MSKTSEKEKPEVPSMKVVGLVSGGKDSMFNLLKCKQHGHEIVCLANLAPFNDCETDSYMYQSVGHECVEYIAKVMGLPMIRRKIQGTPRCVGKDYITDEADEVEDLYTLLHAVKDQYPDIQGVSVGAIASTYQKTRVEHVCERLGLTMLAYLWGADQKELLQEMLNNQMEAITIKIACCGLNQSHLGQSLRDLQPTLLKVHEKYGAHICGEGGEYETLVINCPSLYQESLHIKEAESVLHSDDPSAPVYYLNLEMEEPSVTYDPNGITWVV
uniref:Diphthine--ammonia ligase n=1 Tax=Panagrellus redivivus TaxID=6233 RepID=A0A7E4VVF3_PANRE